MNSKSVFASYLKKAGVGLVGLALSTGAFAQKAELNLKLAKPNGSAASGIVHIAGSDTTINDNAFLSPKNYILKNITGIDDPVVKEEEIVVAGNPTNNGNTKLVFRNYQKLEGMVSAFTITGAEIGRADIAFNNELSFSTKPGIIFVQYINGPDKKTFKIVNNSNAFNMQIIQEQSGFAAAPQKQELKSAKGAFSDDYSLSYTDPTLNIENYFQNFTVTPGNKLTIDKILQWTDKGIKYSLNTNTNTKIKATKIEDATVLDEQTTTTGIIPTKTINNRFDNDVGIQVLYEVTGQFTDTARFTRTQFKNDEFIIDTLRNGWFYVTINGNGTNYTLKQGSATIATAPVGQQILFKKQGDQTGIDIIVERTNYVTSNTHENIAKGMFTETITLNPAAYSHTLTGSALSSIVGKVIKDNTQLGIIKDFTNAPGDTAWVSTASGAFNLTWSDNNQTETTKIVGKNVPGHSPNSITFTMDDNENRSITFTGLSYSFSQTIHVQNQTNEDVSNVSIAGGDATVVTNSTGRATYIRTNLSTDVNNLPFANYATNASFTGPNIQTLNTIINSIVGANPEVLKNVNQIYSHLINGTAASSIAGKTIKDNTQIDIVKAVGDTAWVSTVSGAFSYSWSDLNKTLNVDIGSLNVPGHSPGKVTQNIGASANVSITFTGLSYSLSKPLLIQNQFAENVASASIAGGDAVVVTGADGKATVVKSSLATDVNNLPNPNYVLSLTITKSNIQTSNQNVNANAGTNTQSLLNIVQEYEQWLYGTSTSPDGALVQVWKGGTAVQSATVSGGAYETNHIKRTTKTFVADSTTITKANYTRFTQMNTTLAEGGNKLEAILNPFTVYDFDILLRTINGDIVTTLTQKFDWDDGTTTYLTPDATGTIHVQKTVTGTSNKVKISNTSQKYSQHFAVFRYLNNNNNLVDTNYCQIQKFDGIDNIAELSLTGVPGQLKEYVSDAKVKVPDSLVGTYGDSIPIIHPVLRDMMGGSNGGRTIKFISTPSIPLVDVVQFLFNYTTGLPVAQTDVDRAKAEQDKILAIYTLNDGTKLMNYTSYQISSTSDSRWQAIVARGGDNVSYTYFYTGSPYNGTVATTVDSPNGKPRIKSSNSEYSTGNTNGIIFTEIYQQFTNNKDPIENSGPWVKTSTGEVSEFGKTMARLIYLFNQGTKTQ